MRRDREDEKGKRKKESIFHGVNEGVLYKVASELFRLPQPRGWYGLLVDARTADIKHGSLPFQSTSENGVRG